MIMTIKFWTIVATLLGSLTMGAFIVGVVIDSSMWTRIGVILMVGTISASIPITSIYLNSSVKPLDTPT